MSCYFDACALVPIFVRELSSDQVAAYLAQLERQIYVSDFGISEVSSAISRRVREDKENEATANAVLAAFDEWLADATTVLPVLPSDIRRAGRLVRRFELKLLTPDAIHLAICERNELTLVTLDQRLMASATEIGVDCEIPAT